MERSIVVVDEDGRVELPEWLRRRLGLKPGARLEVRVEGGRVVLLPVSRAVRARELLGLAGVEEVDVREVEEALGETG